MDVLTKYQKTIVKDCLDKGSGCLVVPMGTGKTLIALTLSQSFPGTGKTLIIAAKTLIQSWVAEIDKFYGDALPYEIFHKEYLSKREYESFQPTTRVVLTTPDVTSLCFKKLELQDKFETSDRVYESPRRPIAVPNKKVGNFLYSTRWKCIIIDEIQSYTSIDTIKCQSMAAIYAIHRWGLSGTPLNEPQMKRVFGYYALIGEKNLPDTVAKLKSRVTSRGFHGLNESRVIRTRATVDFAIPSVECIVKSHALSPEEQLVYKLCRNVIQVAKYNSVNGYSLPTIMFVRQFLVTPFLAFTNMTKYARNHGIYPQVKNIIVQLNQRKRWQTKPSSRIASVISVVDQHPNEKIVIFNCFKSSIVAIEEIISRDRECFVLDSKLTSSQRGTLFQNFQASQSGILLLTYAMGAEGLNLQYAHVALLVDIWWNDAVVQQAIARILRRGQLHRVFVYFFTSNTGIEKGLFDKHADKNRVLREIATGPVTKMVSKMTIDDILTLLKVGENTELIKKSCPL